MTCVVSRVRVKVRKEVRDVSTYSLYMVVGVGEVTRNVQLIVRSICIL